MIFTKCVRGKANFGFPLNETLSSRLYSTIILHKFFLISYDNSSVKRAIAINVDFFCSKNIIIWNYILQ